MIEVINLHAASRRLDRHALSIGVGKVVYVELAGKGVVRGQGLSHVPPRMLEFEATLNFSPSPKVVIFVPDRGVAKLLSLINMSSKHTYWRRLQEGFLNKGVLPATYISNYIEEGGGVKTPRSRTGITTFGEGEKFRMASNSSIRGGPWLKPWPRTTPFPASSTY